MSERLGWLAPAGLLLALSLALLPATDVLTLAGSPDAAQQVTEVIDGLPSESVVLVGFDADFGTYAEIRPTVRTLLADLIERDARLVFVSLTPEGRALALAERARLLAAGVEAERLIDAGFVPGAEAALVRLARTTGEGGGGLPAEPIRLALVVGGNDLGPRSWVEQFAPRVEDVELVAVAPSVLLPELLPYRDSGQLAGLLATPRDGAAYRDLVGPIDNAEPGGPPPLAVLVGLLVAIGMLGAAVVSRLGEALRSSRGREAA
jgi:hypothetical protein